MGFLLESHSRYDTDKNIAYLRNYERVFDSFAGREIALFELGIFRGGSLLMWRDYFAGGPIVGLDFNRVEIDDPTGRIRTYQGLQQDTELLDRIAAENAPEGFDIIIDDASHQGFLTKKTFWHLFDNHLKDDGVYVIEDWGTGYWPDFPDGAPYEPPAEDDLTSHQAGLVGFVKQLVDEQGIWDATDPRVGLSIPRRGAKFLKLEIVAGQVFAWKGKA
jgi:hypothetical protein